VERIRVKKKRNGRMECISIHFCCLNGEKKRGRCRSLPALGMIMGRVGGSNINTVIKIIYLYCQIYTFESENFDPFCLHVNFFCSIL
jgi:hypothetical protein